MTFFVTTARETGHDKLMEIIREKSMTYSRIHGGSYYSKFEIMANVQDYDLLNQMNEERKFPGGIVVTLDESGLL